LSEFDETLTAALMYTAMFTPGGFSDADEGSRSALDRGSLGYDRYCNCAPAPAAR
jgi:hypothetical protein